MVAASHLEKNWALAEDSRVLEGVPAMCSESLRKREREIGGALWSLLRTSYLLPEQLKCRQDSEVRNSFSDGSGSGFVGLAGGVKTFFF